MKWPELKERTLLALDIEAEYAALGITFSGDVRASGFRSCKAMGREDKKSSAWIYAGDNPRMRGRYGDSGGSGESMGLFDFAATYGPYATWKEARDYYVQKAGLAKNKPKTDDDSAPEDSIELFDVPLHVFAISVRGLIERYPGVTWKALARASRKSPDGKGVMLAKYPKKSATPTTCVALPCYGPGLIEGGITGYVLMADSGKPIPLYRGPDAPPEMVPKLNKGNGMTGRSGIENLRKAKRVIKCEGVTDMLAMSELIPKELRKEVVAITNASGAGEVEVPKHFAPALAGKMVDIVHDADMPGQDGTGGWIRPLAGMAQVRNVELPFPVEAKKGKDLRDWITG